MKFQEADSVQFLKFMADDAASYNMSMGLKNSISLIPKVQNYVQFAVNEECVKVKECQGYKNFLAKGKPVFHIEYTGAAKQNNRVSYKDPAGSTQKYCNPLKEAVSRFSTIIKAGTTIGPNFLYCDGKPADTTPTRAGSNSKTKGLYLDDGEGSERMDAIDVEGSEGESSDADSSDSDEAAPALNDSAPSPKSPAAAPAPPDANAKPASARPWGSWGKSNGANSN
jgi:hypothetical protein